MSKIKGIWVLNDTQLAFESENALAQTVNFTSNGISFDRMLLLGDYTSAMTYTNIEDSYSVYTHSGGWINESFRTVDFGSVEQEVSDEWYAGFTKNAKPLTNEDTSETTITYNGSTIATLESGQTATIKTAQTEVEHDIVVKAGSGGGSGGGSAEFNIAYGDTPPEDASKLWIKANTPEAVRISPRITGAEELENFVSTLPTAAEDAAAAAVGTKIYVFGGMNNSTCLDAIRVFDTETNTVTTLSAKLPTAARGMASAVIGTKVYLFGGTSGNYTNSSGFLSTINVFDTETTTLTTLSRKLPTATESIAAAAVGTKIYLFGGRTGNNSSNKLNTINVFDTKSNTLTTLSAIFSSALTDTVAVVVGTKIYLCCGDASVRLNTISVFDTETDTLATSIATLPTIASHSVAAEALGTKIYLFGGIGSSAKSGQYANSFLDTINVFDTETNTATTLSAKLPIASHSIATARVGTKIYLFGGRNGSTNSSSLSTINVFNVLLPLASSNILIESSVNNNLFNLLPNVEIGINSIYCGNAEGYGEKVKAYFGKVVSGVNFDDCRYTSSAMQIESGTELTASVECNVGDLIVAAIATRDTLTLSDGWTLISTSGVNSADTTNGQRLSWAYKFAESTTESITVTQASAQRLYINMVALQGATSVTDNGYSYRNNETSGELTVNKPSGLVLWGMTAPTWSTTTPYAGWTASNDMPIIQLGTDVQQRLGIGLDQSSDASVTLTSGFTATTIIVGSLTVHGMDKFYTATPYTRNEWTEI